MKLTDVIPRKAILPSLKSTDKKGVIQELVAAMKKGSDGERFTASELVRAVLEREEVGSTGVGGGIAVPHARHPAIKGVLGAFGRCMPGIEFSSVDGEPVNLVFLIVSSPTRNDDYLQVLRQTMAAIKRPHFCNFLRKAKTAKDIEEIFKDTEDVVKV